MSESETEEKIYVISCVSPNSIIDNLFWSHGDDHCRHIYGFSHKNNVINEAGQTIINRDVDCKVPNCTFKAFLQVKPAIETSRLIVDDAGSVHTLEELGEVSRRGVFCGIKVKVEEMLAEGLKFKDIQSKLEILDIPKCLYPTNSQIISLRQRISNW
eukprot:TRINITY_DN1319_c0_g2_i10.p1 TRINITY_DN1319_c0_g2~~TRINITY_DN1319_c0_g2_i10.p1  ORF type:complete len:157 (-),score=4.83 TRINITY_DN1319_c0_g2_i10:332-802(-)